MDSTKLCYSPICPVELKPYVGQKFSHLDDGVRFYKVYAGFCGFDVRLSTSRVTDLIIKHRYVLCNREGHCTSNLSKNVEATDASSSKKKRKTRSGKAGCKARVVFKLCGSEGYEITTFIEPHSHPLLQEGQKQFLKLNRQMDYTHQSFVLNCRRANIGPIRSFKLFKELVGSFDKIGCSGNDFKNFSRDVRESIVGLDTQVVLDELLRRQQLSPGFSFHYDINDGKKLTRLFWADVVSINNYKRFGEAVSFDATYTTKKYNMIFAPFTGKDNHGKCITFGAGLLSGECEESYAWLLKKFLFCMDDQHPKLLITDQDPALIKAVAAVLPYTRHRFCMWHIMCKVADKLSVSLRADEDFKHKFNELVWSESIDTNEFDQRWFALMSEYDLNGHKWFETMFEIRERWIPAYFKNLPMSGLFKTTSMSESENNFFQRFINRHDNLIEFFMHFGSAIDAQRHTHNLETCNDLKSFPELVTNLQIEQHAASFYTFSKFKEVQAEIVAAIHSCCVLKMTDVGTTTVYEVEDSGDGTFTLVFDSKDNNIVCGCNLFLRKGLLCKHVFFVLKNKRVDCIPNQYLLPRWSKSISFEDPYLSFGEGSNRKDTRELLYESYRCIGLVECSEELRAELLFDLKELTKKYSNLTAGTNTNNDGNAKKKVIEDFYGCSVPESVSVLSPSPVKTKGSGSRIQSRKEAAIRKANKPKRKCSKCQQLTNHDARNCDQTTIEDE